MKREITGNPKTSTNVSDDDANCVVLRISGPAGVDTEDTRCQLAPKMTNSIQCNAGKFCGCFVASDSIMMVYCRVYILDLLKNNRWGGEEYICGIH